MIGFDSLSDYSLNSDLKRWPDFCFSSFFTYLSLFTIRRGGGRGCYVMVSSAFFCQS